MPKRRESPIKRINPSGQERWIARYTGPDGRRRSAGTFKLKRDAQGAIDAAYDQPELGDTINAYLPRWLDEHPVSERTMRTNQGRIRAIARVRVEGRELGDWPMRDLRRRHGRELVAHMLTVQKRAPEGARNILRSLSAMFEDAITDELCDVNPWRGLKVRDDDRRAVKRSREPRVWTFEQTHTFASHAGAYEAMIRVLADCGLRVGELFALQRTGLHAQDATLEVRGSAWEGQIVDSSDEKNHDRDVPVPPGCLQLLRDMPARIDSPWLFPSPAGRLWRYSNWHRRVWQPTIDRAGIDPTPNELRHSWVTHLRAARIDPADLAAIAGHSEQTAAAHYTHPVGRSDALIRSVIG